MSKYPDRDSVRLSEGTIERLQIISKTLGINRSTLMREILESEVDLLEKMLKIDSQNEKIINK